MLRGARGGAKNDDLRASAYVSQGRSALLTGLHADAGGPNDIRLAA